MSEEKIEGVETPAAETPVVEKADLTQLLSKDMIIAAKDIKTEVVAVPEWGGSVTVRTMTGADRDDFEASMTASKTGADGVVNQERNLSNFRARLCAMAMVNIHGKLLFPNPEDVEKLGQKSSKALDRVMKAAQKLNGIGADDVEELTKN